MTKKISGLCISIFVTFSISGLCFAQTEDDLPEGISKVSIAGYDDCFQISNDTVRVVLGTRGGRVLAYERSGKNVLYLKDESNWDPNAKGIDKHLSAGRFDIGPEQLQTRGAETWHGEWGAKAMGSRVVHMISPTDSRTGIQLQRTFRLDETGSRFRVAQSVYNGGESPVRQCYWSRTFAVHGGVAIVPCDSKTSLMPNLYCMCPNGKTINFRPDDPAVRRVDDFLLVDGPPKYAKLGMDSVKGWVAYQTREDQLFVKRYEVSDSKNYGELAGYNLSIWYPQKSFLPACEIEPIGPMKELQPGEQDSYFVDWWLFDREFPEDELVDPAAVASIVEKECSSKWIFDGNGDPLPPKKTQ